MWLRIALLTTVLAAGCKTKWTYDLPDLATATPSDLSAARDLSVGSDDLAAPPADAHIDMAGVDLSIPPVDLAPAACSGGYLNSDASNACPLGCSPRVESVPESSSYHIGWDMMMSYPHNPPASGPHYGSVATWGRHDEIVAREWWLHNLEHGGIILLYNCPPGSGGVPNSCTDVIAAFQQLHDAQPLDQFGIRRILITPDPLLPARTGAVAWNWSYTSDTLDTSQLMIEVSCFINARYGRAPENAP